MSFRSSVSHLALASWAVLCVLGWGIVAAAQSDTRDAQEAPVLSLDAVIESTRRHHPAIEQAKRKQEAAQAKRMHVRGVFDPTVRASLGGSEEDYYRRRELDVSLEQQTPFWGARVYAGYRYGRSAEDSERFPSYYSNQTLPDGELRAGIEVPLLAGGWIDAFRAKRATADAEADQAEAKAREAELKNLLAATYAYWVWTQYEMKVMAAEQLVALARVRQEQFEQEVELGSRARFDAIDARRILLEREREVAEAIRKAQAQRIKLSFYFRNDAGQPNLEAYRPPDPPDGLSQAQIEQTFDISCHPALQGQMAGVQRQEVERNLASNRRLPKADLTFEISQDLGQETNETLLGTVLMAKLKIEFPLLLRYGRGSYAYESALLESEQEKSRMLRDQLESAMRTAISNLKWFQREAQLDRDFVRTAEQVLEGEYERFRAGSGSLITLNIRERNVGKARSQYASSVTRYFMALDQWRIIEELLGRQRCEGSLADLSE